MRVLVAVDGSAGAGQAVALAGAIAWPPDSTLRIVSIVEPVSTLMMTSGPWRAGSLLPAPEIEAQVVGYHEDQVAGVVRTLQGSGRTVEGAVLRGTPATAIVDEATQVEADVVLIGSRGHGPIASLVLGSVSAEVADHAPCPVLVARTPAISKAVLATDGSEPSGAAEGILARWPIFEGLPIRVVSVADVDRPWHTGVAPTMYAEVMAAHARDLEEARTDHGRIAEEAATRLVGAGRTAEAHARAGDAAAEIIAAVDESGADLVVIGSRGQTGLTRMVLGSVARNVLQGTRASVLVVHETRRGASG